jgi:hypothetical protein
MFLEDKMIATHKHYTITEAGADICGHEYTGKLTPRQWNEAMKVMYPDMRKYLVNESGLLDQLAVWDNIGYRVIVLRRD